MENKPNVAGSGPAWLFDIDSLSQIMNYHPVIVENQSNTHADAHVDGKEHDDDIQKSVSLNIHSSSSGAQTRKQGDKTENKDKGKSHVVTITGCRDLNAEFEDSSNGVNAANSSVSTAGQNSIDSINDFSAAGPSNAAMPNLEDLSHDADDVGAEADINNLESIISVSPIPTTRIHKDHPTSQIISDLSSTTQTRSMARAVRDQCGILQMFNEDFHTCMFACFLSQEEPKRVHQALKDPSWIEAMQGELFQFKMQKVWILVDLPYGKRAIGTKWVLKVKIIRCDNGTEFKNADLNQFCGLKGIKRKFSVHRTPQQNEIAERKNRTLIEAARTLLADSLLPIPFWAEAVNTACYVQNRVLVTKPHNKTPYELLHGRLPRKVDEGFLVGYSVCSKAFRVFNSRTRIVQETLHTMNYHPVIAENQSNTHAGFQVTEKAEEEGTQTYVLFPMLSDGSTNAQNNNKDAYADEKEHDDDIQKSVSPDIYSSSSGAQTRIQGDKNENKDKGKSPVVTITGFRDLNAEFEEYNNNSSNGVNTASSSVSTTGQNSIDSTNDFSAAGTSNAAMPNLEDLSHNADDV
nr:hypothetical protein [Tanacetum cinerariifolium]